MTPTSIRIQGEFTVFTAADLKASVLSEPLPREIDLSGVTEIDSAGVQLLVVAKRTARERGQEIQLVGHSPAVIEVFELLNLAAFFGDPLLMVSSEKTK